MSRLAELIAREEGFFVPGSLPQRDNNPGDLRHAPNASHAGESANAIGIEPSAQTGWDDLERQLKLYASRGMTLAELVEVYAPPSENDTERYLNFLCIGLGVPSTTTVAQALEIA